MRKMASHRQTLFGVQAVQLLRSAMIGHFQFVTRERPPIRTVLKKAHILYESCRTLRPDQVQIMENCMSEFQNSTVIWTKDSLVFF